MSAPNPKEAWAKIQNELAKRGTRFGGAGGGPPKGLFGGIGGLILVGGGIWVANNALFNGTQYTSGMLLQLLQHQVVQC
jgi:prohibitin 2